MDGLDYGTPEYRDCMRDVLAMLEQALEIQSGAGDCKLARENLAVLLANANTTHCLGVAVSMLATSWQLVCHVRAQARGTTAEQEIAQVFAGFRDYLA